ncbi:FecR family protein [Dyadobacter sp. LHD-138]|uniref:FecR family protein n=1 Tax=Dyadobacter sp. LHD-138 TaxID=3071413 RepID=UPI0027E03938|nr:FecR family protein [Dyadobacter sp. LHD-138]MDQ6481776.1 FecR family protein [Dyadobacter sp. LHD-138]
MNYSKFTTQDFLMDPSFVQWAREGKNDAFWKTFIANNPFKSEEIEQAKLFVNAVKSFPLFELDAESQESLWERVEQKIEEETPVVTMPLLGRTWWVAACVLMIASWLGWQTFKKDNSNSVTYENLITATDTKKSDLVEFVNNTDKVLPVNLPDGSSVSLKKRSRLAYFKNRFGTTKREVYMSGEAFFEITKNPAKPFFVYANELITKVLGTSFIIKAYPNDKQVNVSVKTGKVSVFTQFEAKRSLKLNSNELDGVVLTPNQQITLDRQELRLSRTLIHLPEVLSAADTEIQSFEFDDVPVAEIFAKIEKAYGVEIVYDEELLSACKMTASLDNVPLYEKIEMICKGLGATYEMIDAKIVIESNGCS